VRVNQTERRNRINRSAKHLERPVQNQIFADAYRVPATKLKDRMRKVIHDMGLGTREQERAGRLSGGYKQLLSLACTLIHEPKLLFLDEPTAGLSPLLLLR
jgi:ABC-type multidrug transport system ATPase subunit